MFDLGKRFALVDLFVFLVGTAGLCPSQEVRLSELGLQHMTAGWGAPQADRSVQRKPLRIAGREFERGVGTHAPSALWIELEGGAKRFTAFVGVDDEVGKKPASVEFRVVADGKTLFRSGVMRAGQTARRVDVDLAGAKQLLLLVTSAGDGIHHDHANWAEARFRFRGPKPVAVAPPREAAVILTPPSPPEARIRGPVVTGARPGRPFLFRIPATGKRPMTFAAKGLPDGLRLDAESGIITGSVAKRGEHVVTLRAGNAAGQDVRRFTIVVGDRLALTPPMGWNSWYVHLHHVTDRDIRAAADAMIATGLADHGFAYVNIDDGWSMKPGSADPLLDGPARDATGAIRSNKKFPDMKSLTDYIHGKGLKAGLYTSPGPRTCAGYAASHRHERIDAQRFAEWGFDFLKYDWCSYGKIAKDRSREELMKPYAQMGKILADLDRDIVFNLCQYGMGKVWEWGATVGGNCWRTTGDLGLPGQNQAAAMYRIGQFQDGLHEHAGPGGWNDPDYLLIGRIRDFRNWRAPPVPTSLTPNEQYTHVSLWCLIAAPLILSGDITRLDDFTLGLLTNDEVIEVDQDPAGRAGRCVARSEDARVWARELSDGSKAVGLFNLGEFPIPVTARWKDLGIEGEHRVRDLWRQRDLGTFDGSFTSTVARHGVVLVRVFP